MMKRKFLVLMFAIFSLLLVGCGGDNKGSAEADNAAPVVEEPAPVVEEPPVDPHMVIADNDLSNLQLDNHITPVFDKLTIAQRQEKGLNTVLPDLTPYRVEGQKIAYLTFDDGPDANNTPAILDILKEYDVPGTFYVTGRGCEAYPEVLKRIYEEHHAIGNHSYNHDYDDLYASAGNFINQMKRNDDVIMGIIGVRPLILRAPGGTYGSFDDSYYAACKNNGYEQHDWNASVEDATPENPSAERMVSYIEEQTRDDNPQNAIVLMHSSQGHLETVRALPAIIELLKERGYTFGVVTPMTPQPW